MNAELNYGINDWIHYCQWTMTASRRYPIMKKIVRKAIAASRETAERNRISIADFDPSNDDLVQISGPSY